MYCLKTVNSLARIQVLTRDFYLKSFVPVLYMSTAKVGNYAMLLCVFPRLCPAFCAVRRSKADGQTFFVNLV